MNKNNNKYLHRTVLALYTIRSINENATGCSFTLCRYFVHMSRCHISSLNSLERVIDMTQIFSYLREYSILPNF